MTDRSDRPQDPSQDLSKLMEQSVSTLQEVDRRLQRVRSDLAALMSRAATTQGQGDTGFGPGPGAGFSGYPPPGAYLGFPAAPLAPLPFGSPAFQGLGPSPLPGAPAMPNMPPGGVGEGNEGAGAPGRAPGQGPGPQGRAQRPPTMTRVPSVDLVDQGEEYVVQVELPGVKKEDLDVRVTDRMVTLLASTKPVVEEGVVLLNERPPTTYRRVIPLPGDVASTRSKAAFQDGILTLTVPKATAAEAPKRLDVAYR